ncbi:MAG: UDP-N-acetylglucosamine 2-epimerase (non-hydrolyzing) [Thermoanaerobaculia bacterium]
MRLGFVVGARPNFMKVAPVLAELSARREGGVAAGVEPFVVHTGQHYDGAMSDVFFRDLGMPEPDDFLGVGSDTHGRQTAKVMTAFEDVCDSRRPDGVVVVGDVNSTLACALVAAKRGIGVAHVEAGLRSYDRSMPEEVNRVLTDQVSDLLLTTCEEAEENLAREGIARRKVRFVGNAMIDSLLRGLSRAGAEPPELERRARAAGLPHVVVTLHRPGNVDAAETLAPLVKGLEEAGRRAAVLFPVHPRTAARLAEHGMPLRELAEGGDAPLEAGVYALPPLPYLEFVRLLRGAAIVLTDSGGIQEETTVMGVPCATLRPNTERPVTVRLGTNELVARTPEAIAEAVDRALSGRWKKGSVPPLWDGSSAGRIVDALIEPGWLDEARSRRG